ncbi:MAG: SIMPL domain-containing protein [Bradyrhizobiaceae bacterium]|nr:SIMPL domain-containing protein [Bradyrhizobiaceae bacterium]
MEPRIISAIAVSAAVILGTWILGSAWKSTHYATERINVTGLATRDFSSDLIVWSASFERKANVISEAYPLLKQDAERIRKYLADHGIKDADIVFDAVDIRKEYRSVQDNDRYYQQFDGFRLAQSVRVESRDLDRVESVSREISELLNAGIELTSQQPQYYYTKLAELKLDMLSKASANGRARADSVAQNAGSKLGSLRTAETGIFQITGQNANEDYTWGGAFNTTSREKTASITVRMEFEIR